MSDGGEDLENRNRQPDRPPTADRYFSSLGDRYLSRPGYPDQLFDFLASLCERRSLAWDCGTGNGQAAQSLLSRFDRVVATDHTPEQIAFAERACDPRIEFRVADAGASGLPPGTVDLVTVAQAVHWFDFDAFATEVGRVLRPGGVLAVWCYRTPTVSPPIDRLIAELYDAPCLAAFWSPLRRYIDEDYNAIPLPFPDIPAPEFTSREEWAWPRFECYLRTWQAVALAYQNPAASAFVDNQLASLAGEWGTADVQRSVRWRLRLRVGVKGRHTSSRLG